MAPPYRPRPLRKDNVPHLFKSSKAVVLNDSIRNSTVPPNIQSAAWSPTGAMISHSTNVNLRVWNPERPDIKASVEMKDGVRGGAHANSIEKIMFNPCVDAVLASTSTDCTVKVWDVRLPGMAVAGTSIGSSGGVISGGSRGGVNGKAGECKFEDKGLFLTWHPNGTEILIGQKEKIQAVDLRRADVVMDQPSSSNKYDLTPTDRVPVKDRGAFHGMAFSHSGRELFVTTENGPVKVLDYPSMETLHEISGNTGATYAVQQSPTGNYLAVGGDDSMITLWDTTSWLCSHIFTQQIDPIRDLSFSFDGAYLVVGSYNDVKEKASEKGLRIYHVDTGDVVHTIDTSYPVTRVAWHPYRYALAYAGDSGGLKIIGSLSGLNSA